MIGGLPGTGWGVTHRTTMSGPSCAAVTEAGTCGGSSPAPGGQPLMPGASTSPNSLIVRACPWRGAAPPLPGLDPPGPAGGGGAGAAVGGGGGALPLPGHDPQAPGGGERRGRRGGEVVGRRDPAGNQGQPGRVPALGGRDGGGRGKGAHAAAGDVGVVAQRRVHDPLLDPRRAHSVPGPP